jgi:hypothetical protein
MKYSEGTTFYKFGKFYTITEITDETVEFICQDANQSGYRRCTKMDTNSFEESLDGAGIVVENFTTSMINNFVNIEDLLM